MNKLIIGFTGLAGSGKDTAALAIERYAKEIGSARRLAFADPMRDMLRALGVPNPYIVDRALKERPVPVLGRSYRQLAQTLGTEWGRVCHGEDFWVNVLAMRAAAGKEDIILITDVRFPNEVDWLEQHGGFLVKIVRPGVESVTPHESERWVETFDAWRTMFNDRSQEEFEEEAIELLREAITAQVRGRQRGANPFDPVV